MQPIIKSPSECTELEISTFVRMTEEGEQVPVHNLRDKVVRAHKLVFIWKGEHCVAIAAVKNPDSKL